MLQCGPLGCSRRCRGDWRERRRIATSASALFLSRADSRRGAHREREAHYGWEACLVRRDGLLVVVVSWLVPARSSASSSR